MRVSRLVRWWCLAGLAVAACSAPERDQVVLVLGQATGAMTAELGARLSIAQRGAEVFQSQAPVSADTSQLQAVVPFSGVERGVPATFDLKILWTNNGDRLVLEASADVPTDKETLDVVLSDADVKGKPDSDVDGASDLKELLAGTDPADPSSLPCAASGATCGGSVQCCDPLRCSPSSSTCVAPCTGNGECGGLTCCAGDCVDTMSSSAHCGSCPRTCSTGESCQAGTCASSHETSCADGLDNDGDGSADCADPDCDVATCTAGGTCQSGACCGDGMIQASEVCDGPNLGTDSCQARGFTGGALACSADCRSVVTSGCSGFCTVNGDCVPPTCEQGTCNLADGSCVFTVLSGTPCYPAAGCPGGVCVGGCQAGTCSAGACSGAVGPAAEICYDGIDNDCDGLVDCSDADCGGKACGSGLVCAGGACVPMCGNGVVELAELCDGSLGAASCVSLGYGGGTLGCAGDCTFDVSGCLCSTTSECPPQTCRTAVSCTAPPGTCTYASVPDATACYPFPAATAGAGACHAGSCQSGACVSAVGPVLELCNGQDDDCDGMIDESCQ